MIPNTIDLGKIPRHVAIVMDGNGRWAKERGLPRTAGHAQGEEALVRTIEAALELQIPWLSVYAFSTENWKRPKDEVNFILNFSRDLLRRRREYFNEKGVRFYMAGKKDYRIPRSLVKFMDETEELTKGNKNLNFVICVNYGGRKEIIDAINKMVADNIPLGKITEARLRKYFYLPRMPDPDLVIRTSNEFRISNFLLFQIAYSELYFTKTLWPDFTGEDLFKAVEDFQRRNRRFGKVQ